jgi:KaiC/GvpD/RAD55 family RecA-like ATPase
MYINDLYKIRKMLYKLVENIKKTDATILLSTEVPEGKNMISRFGVEEFVCDGIIILYYMGHGEGVFRNIEIRKMRRTNHKNGTFPMEITSKGIVVRSDVM